MQTCLVVANKTLPTEQLAEAIQARIARGGQAFYVVVPLTPVSHGATWDEAESAEAAQARLDAFLEAVRSHGAEADGEVGDRDPIQAVRDVIRARTIDEVILSTLPQGVSRWLQMDVPSRLAREIDLQVTVITQVEAAPAPIR
jgi:nucleotide-binding universal stress UspA family protein